jgi:hypothetical protein
MLQNIYYYIHEVLRNINHNHPWTTHFCRAKATPKKHFVAQVARFVVIAMLLHRPLCVNCHAEIEWITGHPNKLYLLKLCHVTFQYVMLYVM